MYIFLLITFPLFSFFVIHLENSNKTWVDCITFRDHGLPFVRGMLSYIPAVILMWIFRSIFNASYNPAGLYFYYLFEDYYIYYIIVIAVYLLFSHLLDGEDSFLSFSLFSGGFFKVVSIVTVIRYYNQFDSYILFMLPLLRFSLIFLSSCIVTRIFSSDGFARIVLFAGLAFIPAVLNGITYLYKINFVFLSFIISIFVFAASFLVSLKFKE